MERTDINGDEMVVYISPLQVLSFVPENWYNRKWCDITIAVSPKFSISTEAARIIVVAEDVSLASLSMTGG